MILDEFKEGQRLHMKSVYQTIKAFQNLFQNPYFEVDELNNRQTFIFVYMSMYLEYICVVIPIWIFKTIFWRQNYTVFLLNTP